MFKFDSWNWDAMADSASDDGNGVNYAKIGRIIYRNESDVLRGGVFLLPNRACCG